MPITAPTMAPAWIRIARHVRASIAARPARVAQSARFVLGHVACQASQANRPRQLAVRLRV